MPLVDNGHGFLIDSDDPGEPGYADPRKRWSVHRDELSLLAALAKDRFVFEIGTGYGVGTKALAKYARKVTTCDIDLVIQRDIHPALEASGIACLNARPEMEGPHFGLIFIDGNHMSEPVASDTRWAAHNLAEGGLIVWHDWKWPTVRKGVQDALGVSEWCIFQLETPAGIAIGYRI
jgi:predicted O-methyltransferase YrrM